MQTFLQFLELGGIGLGFLLAYFTYRMFKHEQENHHKPRMIYLISIGMFAVFSFGLVGAAIYEKMVSNPEVSCPKCEEVDVANLENTISRLRKRQQNCLNKEQVAIILDEYIYDSTSQSSIISAVKRLVDVNQEFDKCKEHYAFNLFTIEKHISSRGGSINLAINHTGNGIKSFYKILLFVLKDLGYYSGQITDERNTAYDALKSFQQAVNEKLGRQVFQENQLGIIGAKTLEQLRIGYRYRNRSDS